MGCSPRAKMILSTATVVLSVIGAIVGLTIGLQDQPPPCGGSPECDVESSGQRADKNQVIHARERRSADVKVGTDYKYDKFSGNVRFLDSIEPWAASSEYRVYPSAAVTTDTNICSKIGADILRDGVGSAVDSAIATQLCVCIVNAQSCGIGGGHIAVIYERPRDQSEKMLMALIARERAPAAAYRDMFVNNTQGSVKGGLAVAVPGEIRGFHEAWKIFGRLPWSDLFQPAIQLCEEGFLVERSLAAAILDKEVEIREDPNLSELFVKEDGTLLKQGDLLVNPKLGRTMRAIAEDPLTFYSGALAEDIVDDLNEYSGIVTLEDLHQYRSTLDTPINITLQNGDLTVHSPSSPSSGPVLEFILNILDGYNFDSTSISDDASKTLTYHRITEAFKFAFAKRSMLGDAEFVDVSDLVYNLTSDEYAESIRQQIDDTFTHDIEYYGPTFDVIPDHGTTHMNVLAPDGAAVALSGTVNLFFGSKCRGSRTGIIFNNEMDDFSTPGTRNDFGVPASPSNYIVPGKVPMSSMNPALFVDKDGSVVFMSGGAGGTKITTQTAFVSINSLWLGLGLDVATDTARIHHQLSPNQIVFENWIDQMVLMGLRAKNHTVVSTTGNAVILSIRNSCFGVPTIQGRSKKASDCVEAISDGRKGGFPDGF